VKLTDRTPIARGEPKDSEREIRVGARKARDRDDTDRMKISGDFARLLAVLGLIVEVASLKLIPKQLEADAITLVDTFDRKFGAYGQP
jgi:hypothetical protein